MASPRFPRPKGAHQAKVLLQSHQFHEPIHGYFKSFDGTRLFYSIEGEGKPLIFCYGLVCSSLHWTYQIEYFRKNYQAVWFDYRGHHNSDRPTNLKTLSIPSIAMDLRTLMDELEIEKAVILGHSMGVNVALDFYKSAPDRVEALVLANGTARNAMETLFNNNILQSVVNAFSKLKERSPLAIKIFWELQKKNPLINTMIARGGFNTHLAAKADIDLYVKQVMEMDPEILIELMNNYNNYDAAPWLDEIKVPTLIIAGDEDQVIPLKEQRLMHQLISGSELKVVHHGSHCPQMDLPDLVNLTIENFLENLQN